MSKKSALTKRQKLIIEMLAAFNADNPFTIQAISEKLKLSSRTVLEKCLASTNGLRRMTLNSSRNQESGCMWMKIQKQETI